MSAEKPDPVRPEQIFMDDPAVDRVLGVVMTLATEVYVLRDRLRAVERQLEDGGSLNRDALNREPTLEDLAADTQDREAFVAGLMQNLQGLQVSKGAAQGREGNG